MNISLKKVALLFLYFYFSMFHNVRADTPTDEELLELEQQIKQQEAEQAKAKQRAAEEARRKAEEKRLREERAQLEEERRKLEEERQAERKRRQEEEEKTKRLQEEQQRATAEAEKRKQFEQFMSNAQSAMNNKEYANALQAYTQALKLEPDNTAAIEGQTKASEYQKTCNLLIGEWNWFLAKLVVHKDGTMQALALIPNNGTWECTDPEKRVFTLRWVVGGWVDTVTLSPDGNKADAVNNIGMRFKGTRIDSEADLSSPKEVPL